MGLIPDGWKLKAELAFAEAMAKTAVLTQQATDYLEEKIPEVKDTIGNFVDENKPKVEQAISDAVDIVKEKTEVIKESIEESIEKYKESKTMSHKILMMGGRRAGKSTILASILYVLKQETPGSLCTINDMTDYTQTIIGSDGQSYPLPTLDSKRLEVSRYMKTHSDKATFLVDMAQTYGKGSYILRVNSGQTNINLEFVDVPGEWMRRNVEEFNKLKEQVMTSDVYVIAVDTPFLMQEDEDINAVYNRVQEITDVISEMNIDPKVEADRRQIILCPVKCEKWINAGQADLVSQKVKHAYKDLINKWIKFPNVNIWIMPIQTVGGLESVRLLPAKVFFKTAQEKGSGTSCSEDEDTGLLLDKDGNTVDPDSVDRVEDDMRWEIDYTSIPLSWYRKNGKGFKPDNCEQPGFHILRFLVEKEENILKQKAESDRMTLENRNIFFQFLTRLFNPTFGQYLPVWRDVINEMKNRGLLKEQGDGFEHVTHIVE